MVNWEFIYLGKLVFYFIVYLYSAQYLHVLQDSKHYLIHPTLHIQTKLSSNWHSPDWKTEA